MKTQLTELEYIPADPKLRRAVLIIGAGAVTLAALAIGWFLPWLNITIQQARYNGTISIPLACYLFLVAIAILSFGVVWFGLYAARFGRSVLETGQYPPPGARVIRRTPIVRGPVAAFTGRGQFVLGILLVLCGIALFAIVVWGFVILA